MESSARTDYALEKGNLNKQGKNKTIDNNIDRVSILWAQITNMSQRRVQNHKRG